LSDSPELLKPNPEVTDSELQIEIGNLKAENESLRQRFAESRDTIETLNRGKEALNEQLATANQSITEQEEKIESLRQELTENTRYYTARLNEAGATIGTIKDKLEAAQVKNQRLQNDLGNSQAEVAELRSQLETERADRKQIEAELSELKQNSAPAPTVLEKLTPDAATILSQLRARRKKSKTDLADLEAILEILENSVEKIEEGG
jgi:chromosome segregation ATPase